MGDERFEPKDLPFWQRVVLAAHTELVGIHPRLHVYNRLARLVPPRGGAELRAKLFRLAGVSVGLGTRIHGPLNITGPGNWAGQLRIGANCDLGAECTLDLSEKLELGDGVTLEPGAMILTSTHELDFPQHRAGKIIMQPVRVGPGAWLKARVVVLPGVTVGAGAVVEAGAVVNKDVEPHTRVGGIPAVKLEALSPPA